MVHTTWRFTELHRALNRIVPGANSPRDSVKSVRNTSQGVEVVTAVGVEKYDAVVLASHSDQSLALLDKSERTNQNNTSGNPLRGQRSCSSY